MCDKFQPTIFESQLCYSVDIAKLKGKSTKSGKTNGLFLLLDPNPYHLNSSDKDDNIQSMKLPFFKVHIHTLAQFTAYGPGTFSMSGLKRMTGTKSFKQLPDKQKKCVVHNREECQTQKYLDQVERNCDCHPWDLKTDWNKKQVENKSMEQFHFLGEHLLWPRKGSVCFKPNFNRQKLFGSMYWSLCRHNR